MDTFPTDDMELTRLLVVSDLDRSRDWYTRVLGASVHREYGGTSCVLRLLDGWLLLVTPTVTFAPPDDRDRVSAEMIFGVPDWSPAGPGGQGAGSRGGRGSRRGRGGEAEGRPFHGVLACRSQ